MSAEENKALSNRVAQAISGGDLDALDDLMAPELAEEFKRDVAEIRRAFPDYAGTNVEQSPKGRRWPIGSCFWARTWESSRGLLRPASG